MKTTHIFFLSCLFLLCSCGTGLKISSEHQQKITSNFSGTFANTSYILQYKEKAKSEIGILSLFNIYDANTDSFSISFPKKNQMQLSYVDETGAKTSYFEGKFTKRGYFEAYLIKQRIEIPPFFSILYSNVHIDRVRIGMTKKNELVIDKLYENGGNIFIFAGGSYHRDQYYFEPKEKKIN
ncbi:hypothetical protein [Aquimarina algicola]|uniref:Uncharacterized protein n=1 Tax=Aquimarina algicola TaxID=2589995 RepID=A0A504JGB0_9FLAO|nr:hypothetical protein [Aquimarina algicola]TPN86788.1 hypothetical protein FHK87_04075 [Aquimarina algicola]